MPTRKGTTYCSSGEKDTTNIAAKWLQPRHVLPLLLHFDLARRHRYVSKLEVTDDPHCRPCLPGKTETSHSRRAVPHSHWLLLSQQPLEQPQTTNMSTHTSFFNVIFVHGKTMPSFTGSHEAPKELSCTPHCCLVAESSKSCKSGPGQSYQNVPRQYCQQHCQGLQPGSTGAYAYNGSTMTVQLYSLNSLDCVQCCHATLYPRSP